MHRAHHLRPLYIPPEPLASHSVHQRQPRRPRQSHQSQNGNFRLNLLGPLVPDPIEPQFMPDCQSTPRARAPPYNIPTPLGPYVFLFVFFLVSRSRLIGTVYIAIADSAAPTRSPAVLTTSRCLHVYIPNLLLRFLKHRTNPHLVAVLDRRSSTTSVNRALLHNISLQFRPLPKTHLMA